MSLSGGHVRPKRYDYRQAGCCEFYNLLFTCTRNNNRMPEIQQYVDKSVMLDQNAMTTGRQDAVNSTTLITCTRNNNRMPEIQQYVHVHTSRTDHRNFSMLLEFQHLQTHVMHKGQTTETHCCWKSSNMLLEFQRCALVVSDGGVGLLSDFSMIFSHPTCQACICTSGELIVCTIALVAAAAAAGTR